MVRLKNAYIVRCDDFIKNEQGEVTEIRCTYIPESRSGQDTSGINVKGTIHWVSASTAIKAEVRLYDRLFNVEDTSADGDFKQFLNPNSLEIITEAIMEPSMAEAASGDRFQFIRKGYFTLDGKLSTPERPVFNRTVTLKDGWVKASK
jgi:glutaminyl-tRNA synthetase